MSKDSEYFYSKRGDKIYISSSIDPLEQWKSYWFSIGVDNPQAMGFIPPDDDRKYRFASKVFDIEEPHEFVKVKGEVVLRVTEKDRQEVKAIFYEDSRELKNLTIQRYERREDEPNTPHKRTNFTFTPDETEKLRRFIDYIRYVQLPDNNKLNLDDSVLDNVFFNEQEKMKFFSENEDLVSEFVSNEITKSDIVALGYRKKQLELFEELLTDEEKFEQQRIEWNKRREEDVWQQFFENNPWIFGYGLSYIFSSRIDNKKLEQITTGSSILQSGKRVDALMKTRGLISSLCFVEIKKHNTDLLTQQYRPDCWRVSPELAGSIAQLQKTVQKAVKDIRDKIEFKSDEGDPTGDIAYIYQPKSFVVVGSLKEFDTQYGINEDKFCSFELFRKNLVLTDFVVVI